PAGQYNGTFQIFGSAGDPEDQAISGAIAHAAGAIKDCSYKDFGVGFLRNQHDETDTVAIALGKPPPTARRRRHRRPHRPHHLLPRRRSLTSDARRAHQFRPFRPVKPCGPAVTNAISLNFSRPGLGSISATISNSSDLNGKCTYDANPFNTHRDFNV